MTVSCSYIVGWNRRDLTLGSLAHDDTDSLAYDDTLLLGAAYRRMPEPSVCMSSCASEPEVKSHLVQPTM